MSHPDGAALFARAFLAGLKPDPELWVDQWSEEFMVIPDESGAAATDGPEFAQPTLSAPAVARAADSGCVVYG